MRKKSKLISVLILVISITSCEDILEDDITNSQVNIIAPREGDTIEGNTVQFQWELLKGADNYTIQIYNNSSLIQDTLVSSSPYTQVLSSDRYQWRVKGENGAYETQYTFPESFSVLTSSDLTNQTLILNSPSNNLYTNQASIIFTWSGIAAADFYTFELIKEASSGSTTIFFEENITDTSLELDGSILNEDAEYTWKVKGVNETTETPYSSRTFFIDTVAPPIPSLLSPDFEEAFLLSEVVSFSWEFPIDPGPVDSTIESFYEISSDKDFNTIVFSGNSIITNFNFTFSESGTYYWRVRGEDLAGNIGSYNLNGKLQINE